MKYTPLFRIHCAAGAVFEPLTEGWAAPLRFGEPAEEARRMRESVGIADWSWIAKVDLWGAGVHTAVAGFGFRVWPLGGLHALATCEPARKPELDAWIAARQLSATDVTGGYANFLVAGPQARQVLRKLTSLDLERSGQTSLAHVQAIVLRQDLGGLPAYQVLVGRDYGESVWESLLHAGEEFHLEPVGVEAVRMLC